VILISDPISLDRFRRENTGSKLLEIHPGEGEILLDSSAPGAGKSTRGDQAMVAAIRSYEFDLVVYLTQLRQVIAERPLVKTPQADINVLNLQPRPQSQCGEINNQLWLPLERRGLSLLGKVDICSNCENGSECDWPSQYSDGLKGRQVIFGTQSHLSRDPNFLGHIIQVTKAQNVLLILDEIDFAIATFRRSILPQELYNFIGALNEANEDIKGCRQQWLNICNSLLRASSEEIRSSRWRVPQMNRELLLQVQRAGSLVFGDEFKCLTYNIQQLCKSPIYSREKDEYDQISYANLPIMSGACIVFSSSANPEFIEHRLGAKVVDIFGDYRFEHSNTELINIASRIGMKKYFKKNSPQIFDFFAQRIAQQIQSGQRCLLITKKKFLEFCADEIGDRLRQAGFSPVMLLPGQITPETLKEPNAIPLINYGIAGTNLFEEFNCAYCLMGYYTRLDAINMIIQDLLPSYLEIPLKIFTAGLPLRRRITVIDPIHRFYYVNRSATAALAQMEMEVVWQAIGRVRPFTKPREIITFQCGCPTKWEYTYEFADLAEARKHFELHHRRQLMKMSTTAAIKKAKLEGLSQTEIASLLDLHVRTIKRHWNL